ncbi:MAG: biotin-dependent carboxyltransferase family protein [Deltaproteobacteria bacterium]|nr:biotin-dependent carboxyltransferase family protein [Deltaproteobacteria bacterium]
MKAFEVLHPGIYTTLQDLGRRGFMKYGTPASGVADSFSAKVANLMVGNLPGAAVLETTLFRLELLALEDVTIAVTGGDLSPVQNKNPLPMWQAISLKKGDQIAFRARKKGFRAFLAIRGGFGGPKFMDSRSVYVRGMMGSPLKAGEILESEDAAVAPPSLRPLPPDLIPDYADKKPLRVMLGPQEDRFTSQGIETFLSSDYTVSPQSDRMGYRLEGPKIQHVQGADIISESIARGAVQVPGDGKPIIMLWDAQVSGGYTKIATVISADLDRLAQVMPGEKLRFQAVPVEEAHEALREFEESVSRVRKMIEG